MIFLSRTCYLKTSGEVRVKQRISRNQLRNGLTVVRNLVLRVRSKSDSRKGGGSGGGKGKGVMWKGQRESKRDTARGTD